MSSEFSPTEITKWNTAFSLLNSDEQALIVKFNIELVRIRVANLGNQKGLTEEKTRAYFDMGATDEETQQIETKLPGSIEAYKKYYNLYGHIPMIGVDS